MNYTVDKLLKRLQDANICDDSLGGLSEEDRFIIEFDAKNNDVVANYLYFIHKEVLNNVKDEKYGYPYTYKIEDKGNGKYKLEFSIGDILCYNDPVSIIALEEYNYVGYDELYFDMYAEVFCHLNIFDILEVINLITSVKKI